MPPKRARSSGIPMMARSFARRRGSMGGVMRRARGYGARVPRGLGALAAVHSFKRVGEPLVIRNTVAAGLGIAQSGGPSGMLNFGTPGFGSAINGTQQIGIGCVFRLAQASAIADLTGLFDNYRIKKVVLRFNPLINSAPGEVSSGSAQMLLSAIPTLNVCPDFDDSVAPTSLTDVLQNSYTRTYRLDKPFTVSLTPRAQSVVTATGATTAGGLAPLSQWFDCQSAAIDHHGLKMWLSHFPICATAGSVGIEITPVYYLEFKNVN